MEGGLLVKWNHTLITRREFDVGIIEISGIGKFRENTAL